MPTKCLIPKCISRTLKKSLFQMPTNEERRNTWITLIHSVFPNLNIPKICHLCENHFKDDDILTKKVIKDAQGKVIFEREFTKKLLKHGANPVFISKREENVNVHIKNSIEDHKFNNTDEYNNAYANSITEPATSNLNLDIISEKEDRVTDDEMEISSEDDEDERIIDDDYKRRAVKFWKSAKKGRYSFLTVQQRFKRIKSLRQLYQWEHYVKKGGNRRNKILYISEYVLHNFKKANDDKKKIYNVDLLRWALEAKAQIDLPSFKAASSWLLNFKRKHGIMTTK